MGQELNEYSEVIAGDPQACFEAITDYESFTEWQPAVKSCTVLKRDGDGLGTVVEFEIDAKIKKISYTLRYSYDQPERISWDYVEGDLKSIEGEYLFEDLGDGSTRATYRLALDPGMFFPKPIRKFLAEHTMKDSVQALKHRVEEVLA